MSGVPLLLLAAVPLLSIGAVLLLFLTGQQMALFTASADTPRSATPAPRRRGR